MYYVNESVTHLCFPAGGVSNPVKFFYLCCDGARAARSWCVQKKEEEKYCSEKARELNFAAEMWNRGW